LSGSGETSAVKTTAEGGVIQATGGGYTGRRLIISQAMAMQISVIDSTKFMVAPLHPFCTQRKF
jgi:predicted glycosyltransferase